MVLQICFQSAPWSELFTKATVLLVIAYPKVLVSLSSFMAFKSSFTSFWPLYVIYNLVKVFTVKQQNIRAFKPYLYLTAVILWGFHNQIAQPNDTVPGLFDLPRLSNCWISWTIREDRTTFVWLLLGRILSKNEYQGCLSLPKLFILKDLMISETLIGVAILNKLEKINQKWLTRKENALFIACLVRRFDGSRLKE